MAFRWIQDTLCTAKCTRWLAFYICDEVIIVSRDAIDAVIRCRLAADTGGMAWGALGVIWFCCFIFCICITTVFDAIGVHKKVGFRRVHTF